MAPPISVKKKLLFSLTALLLVAAVMEIIAFFACKQLIPSRIRNRTAFRGPEDYIAAMRKARGMGSGNAAARMFHGILGWDYPPGMRYTDAAGVSYNHGGKGERRTCTSFDHDLVAAYGDSFTYCSDVPDCETWETYLGGMLKANVLNFGVAGYGTDQAYLKYKINEAGASTPIVILGILPDDINRVVNVFRTFYAPPDRIALTKPIYVKVGDGFRLVPNPVRTREEIGRLNDPEFVRRLGRLDHWYKEDRKRPHLGFPYVLSLWRWRNTVLDRVVFTAGLSSFFPSRPRYPGNLFEDRDALATMCHIVDLFVSTARSRGSTPIIVIMAHRELIEERMKHPVSRVQNLTRHMQEKGYKFVDLIETLAGMRPSPSELKAWYKEHATAEGNRVTARIMARYLEGQSLLGRRNDRQGAGKHGKENRNVR